MTLASTWHLVPYNPDLHSELKPLQGRSSRQVAPRPPRPARPNKATDLLSLFFGKREEPRMYQPPRKGPAGPAPRRTASGPGPAGMHFQPAAEHPGTGAAAVGAAAAPRRAAPAATVSVYPWQKHRGNANQELYVAKLEARREVLRGFDLSLDDNAALLAEWMELIKELDVVLRYKFSTRVAQERDVRRPRSNSFFGSPDKIAAAAALASTSAAPAAADGPEPRRRRSNSFADNSPRRMIFTQTVSSLDSGAAPTPAPTYSPAPTAPSAPVRPTGSAVPVPDEESAAVPLLAAADSPRSVWANASPLSRTSGLCVAVPTVVVPAVVSTTGRGTKCKHGNDPAACKYGDCPARHKKAGSPPSLAKATSPDGKCTPARPATVVTPAAPLQPVATTAAKICKHGNAPGNCKYGTCTQGSPKTIATLGSPAAAGRTAGAPAAVCKHGNDGATCKYGACADARSEQATFEKMVQEELQKLRDESSSAAGLAAICVPAATPATASAAARGTPAAVAAATPAPAIVDVRLAAGLAQVVIPTRNQANNKCAGAIAPAPANTSPVSSRMVATGGKRTVKKKIKIKRRVAGAAAPAAAAAAPPAIAATPSHPASTRQAGTSPKKVVRRLDFAARAKLSITQTEDATDGAVATAAATPAALPSPRSDSGNFDVTSMGNLSPITNPAAQKLAFGQSPVGPVSLATTTPLRLPAADMDDSEATPMTKTAALVAELHATKPGLDNIARRVGATPSPTGEKKAPAPTPGPANVARSLFSGGVVEDEGSSEWL